MTATRSAQPPIDSAPRDRISRQAKIHFLSHGYSQCTMDDLARELGMSKKTIYLHFPSKEAIMKAILDDFASEVKAMTDNLFANRNLTFIEKLHHFTEGMTQKFTSISPFLLRDLQRFAPHLHQHIEDLRQQNVPLIFGQLLKQGQAAGVVRAEIDPAFAIEFWRPAIQNLLHPDRLEQLRLRPDQAFSRALTLFFGGLLTPAGRKEHEKNFSR